MRFAAGFVAKTFATPLPDILIMKMSAFKSWHKAALKVFEATTPKHE